MESVDLKISKNCDGKENSDSHFHKISMYHVSKATKKLCKGKREPDNVFMSDCIHYGGRKLHKMLAC